jgi:predicted transcriptional regulator of viral defense system
VARRQAQHRLAGLLQGVISSRRVRRNVGVEEETALRLHGLSDLMPKKVHLSVPRGFRKRSPRGVVLHKQDLTEEDVEEWIGFRVTTPLKTIRDAARSQKTSPEHLESAVREAVARGLVRRKLLCEENSEV